MTVTRCGGKRSPARHISDPFAARKTIHRRYHDPDDNASLADLAKEYSVGRSTIHRIISGPTPRA
jgi:hypothetical protein